MANNVAVDGNGYMWFFSIGADGLPWYAHQSLPGGRFNGSWHWLSRNRTSFTSLVAAANADGRLEVFGVSGDQLMHTYQVCVGDAFSPLSRLGDDIQGRQDAILDGNGHLQVVTCTAAGVCQVIHQDPDSATGTGWTDWIPLNPANPIAGMTDPKISTNQNGCLQVFVVDQARGRIMTSRQSAPGSDTWTALVQLPGLDTAVLGDLAVAVNNGNLATENQWMELFYRGVDGQVNHIQQDGPNSEAWSSGYGMGIVLPTVPDTANLPDGKIQLLAVSAGTIHANRQFGCGCDGWVGWRAFDPQLPESSPALGAAHLAVNDDGRLQAFAFCDDLLNATLAQTPLDGDWGSSWHGFGMGWGYDATGTLIRLREEVTH
ncbi:hypothetical protein V5P93_005001 [Actinokineospora auranticolor]|uniref:PLL-like beta propeller domain-containing protein n=1 Tax=Actinokineospora auranticolor TaxID=155976 RepID=A0A2S6GK16_9PSEU|nr:hypothetical protein [Actinokineospora auranticolor]PPK65530.1 hypothetical protein CLV40_11313 [Actinokineospora auranticolor]